MKMDGAGNALLSRPKAFAAILSYKRALGWKSIGQSLIRGVVQRAELKEVHVKQDAGPQDIMKVRQK